MNPPLTISGWLRYDVVRHILRERSVRTILEIGPGIGALGVRLARSYDYVGVELDPASARIAAAELGALGRGRIVEGGPGDVDGTFDAVCAFEVLEHIEDDRQELALWRERVKPKGCLILSVPAWPARWGAHDERVGHFRRYEPDGLRSTLEDAGYDNVAVFTYGFPLLSALHPLWNELSRRATAERTVDARTLSSGRVRQPPRWLAPVTRAFSAPFAVAQRPFLDSRRGTGLVAVAQPKH
jgi:SAM-dependent methyltransferase